MLIEIICLYLCIIKNENAMKKVFKKCKTKTDLMKDSRLINGIEWCVYDNVWEGWLKAGYQAYGNEQHSIMESTIEDFCRVMNAVQTWENDPELM